MKFILRGLDRSLLRFWSEESEGVTAMRQKRDCAASACASKWHGNWDSGPRRKAPTE